MFLSPTVRLAWGLALVMALVAYNIPLGGDDSGWRFLLSSTPAPFFAHNDGTSDMIHPNAQSIDSLVTNMPRLDESYCRLPDAGLTWNRNCGILSTQPLKNPSGR